MKLIHQHIKIFWENINNLRNFVIISIQSLYEKFHYSTIFKIENFIVILFRYSITDVRAVTCLMSISCLFVPNGNGAIYSNTVYMYFQYKPARTNQFQYLRRDSILVPKLFNPLSLTNICLSYCRSYQLALCHHLSNK